MDSREQRSLIPPAPPQQHQIDVTVPTSTAYTTVADHDSGIQYDDDGTDDPNHNEDEDEDEVAATAKPVAGWRGWYWSVLQLFQGLGKFFLILAVGTLILFLVLKYTLPSVDE